MRTDVHSFSGRSLAKMAETSEGSSPMVAASRGRFTFIDLPTGKYSVPETNFIADHLICV